MSKLFLRKVRVTLGRAGGIVVGERPRDQGRDPLKVDFWIEATVSGTPNKGYVRIWNLNASHRNAVGREWDWLRIEAGHTGSLYGEGTVSTIGEGFIRDVEHQRSETDIATSIEFADGDKAWRQGTISETLEGSPRDQVLRLHAHMPDVARGDLLGLDETPYKRPTVLFGSVVREMNKLSRSHAFRWSIQNGVLETIPSDGFIDQETIVSPHTGMLGVPTLTDEGIRVPVLLNPQIRPNRVVRVLSETLGMGPGADAGRFRVDRATYSGDNRDGDFRVDVEGTRL